MTKEDTPIANLSGIQPPVPSPIVQNLADIGINQSETLGLTCSPTVLKNLIEMISLPKSKGSEFSKIVLNFEDDKLFWANKQQGIFYLDFGFASANYFDNFWGKGALPISAPKLLGFLEDLRAYPQVTLWANLKTKLFGVQASNVDKFTNFIESDDIKTAQSAIPVKLDADYIPIMKEPENALIYGVDIESTELKTIFERGKKYGASQFPINISSTGIVLSINDSLNPKDNGANVKKLNAKPGSEKLPPTDKSVDQILGVLIEGPATNLTGPISLRFAASGKAPMFISKREKNDSGGILYAGFLLSTKEKSK